MKASLSLVRGRLYILLAALMWSTSGAFTKLLTKPTDWGLDQPALDDITIGTMALPVQIACYRVLFAGLVLVPLLGKRDLAWRPMLLVMGICFALMNALFVTALALGTAANAILLQYTAPMWMYLASVFWLGEATDRRSTIALLVGLGGIAIIVLAGDPAGVPIILVGLGSGVAYAAVVICLRVLRNLSSTWLTTWNFLVSGVVLLPFLWILAPPTLPQLVVLFIYGAVQMGIPYWLMARGLRAVSPAEAGTITLLEPLLNPLWAYLVAGELPAGETYLGGAFILAALFWRYWPVATDALDRKGA